MHLCGFMWIFNCHNFVNRKMFYVINVNGANKIF
jgi:hypothetical protein